MEQKVKNHRVRMIRTPEKTPQLPIPKGVPCGITGRMKELAGRGFSARPNRVSALTTRFLREENSQQAWAEVASVLQHPVLEAFLKCSSDYFNRPSSGSWIGRFPRARLQYY